MPNSLYLAGGRATTTFSALVLWPQGPQLCRLNDREQLEDLLSQRVPIWLRVSGMGQPHRIREALELCRIPAAFSPLVLDTPQSTRVDSMGDVIAVVLHRLRFSKDPLNLTSDQVSMLLTHNCLISIEEAPSSDPFASLTDWLMQKSPVAAAEDLDDLLHYMVDSILDGIFPMLEQMANRLDDLEEAALRDPRPRVLTRAYQLRANLRRIRQQLWPLRHQILLFLRQNQPVMGPDGLQGFQEMAQNVEQIFESCEILRHQCDAVTEAHMASTGNRMNQIMKTLTIVSTIFAPLTFIAGIYGMNFDNMPELHWRYGYIASLVLMGTIASMQAIYLWRRGWFEDWTAPRR
ncbi:MAG: magnesium/cobalt transporter CorA [Cyanobacteria bacterium M_surface_7_m2_037]|nr:magnesium/cobalt transporter CorA [Cyanobacteria bacterium M_surface_7_m2_037]